MRQVLPIALMLALVVGCASSGEEAAPGPAAEGDGPGKDGGEEAKGSKPSTLEEASVPPLQASPPPAESQRDEAKRFDISARGVPIRDVLLGLVEGTDYSVVIDSKVKGEVTLNLRQVSVPDAMDYLSRTYGYGIERINKRFLVRPAKLQTRVFNVNYLDSTREGNSQTRVSSGQVTQTSTEGEGGGGGGGSQTEIVGSEVKTETSSAFWPELRGGLETILQGGRSDQEKLVLHPGAGVVLVRAMPQTLHDVADYLQAVEGGSHRQVVIEAKVIDVQLNEANETGINWSSLGRAGEAYIASSMIGTDLDNQGTDEQALSFSGGSPTLLPQLQGVDPGGFFSAAVSLDNFSAMVNLLSSQGDVNVLSSPRVATVNNQKAVIKVGTDEFFLTDVELRNTGTAATATTQQNFDVELTPFFDGISLDVTPSINGEGMVTMHVHPSVTDVSSQQKQFQFSQDQVFSFPLAKSDVRESDTIVRAQDGQIVVIGGLMQESTTDNQTKVPLLGDIPLLGGLFRHSSTEKVKRELVILLRPRVIYGSEVEAERREKLQELWEEGLQISGSRN
ncbi:pilus (MSHA type) biogenesis protein MshL [Thiohalorhabdus sp.]|uniref:pilus (MSHA type) biogenesis protein MshL n=1 Tax=Thiohalorhabdus sp. TaxID=3094134 RepID=UPI002FC36006